MQFAGTGTFREFRSAPGSGSFNATWGVKVDPATGLIWYTHPFNGIIARLKLQLLDGQRACALLSGHKRTLAAVFRDFCHRHCAVFDYGHSILRAERFAGVDSGSRFLLVDPITLAIVIALLEYSMILGEELA